MRGTRARQLRKAAHEVVMMGAVKEGEFAWRKRKLYRIMKKDWREGRRDGFKGIHKA